MIRRPPRSTLFPYTTSSDLCLLLDSRTTQRGYFKRDALERLWNEDRKSTRLNSSHLGISYAVFCLKKKKCFVNYLARLSQRSFRPTSHNRRSMCHTTPTVFS